MATEEAKVDNNNRERRRRLNRESYAERTKDARERREEVRAEAAQPELKRAIAIVEAKIDEGVEGALDVWEFLDSQQRTPKHRKGNDPIKSHEKAMASRMTWYEQEYKDCPTAEDVIAKIKKELERIIAITKVEEETKLEEFLMSKMRLPRYLPKDLKKRTKERIYEGKLLKVIRRIRPKYSDCATAKEVFTKAGIGEFDAILLERKLRDDVWRKQVARSIEWVEVPVHEDLLVGGIEIPLTPVVERPVVASKLPIEIAADYAKILEPYVKDFSKLVIENEKGFGLMLEQLVIEGADINQIIQDNDMKPRFHFGGFVKYLCLYATGNKAVIGQQEKEAYKRALEEAYTIPEFGSLAKRIAHETRGEER
ncbi:MAG: hypothetical protein FWC68_03970 [Oscillospiraceae bacterium]|nr:hypothetical protein [Oscillospiraceae bacterium]